MISLLCRLRLLFRHGSNGSRRFLGGLRHGDGISHCRLCLCGRLGLRLRLLSRQRPCQQQRGPESDLAYARAIATLGRQPGPLGRFVDVDRDPEAVPLESLLILRLDTPLYYFNASAVTERVVARIGNHIFYR